MAYKSLAIALISFNIFTQTLLASDEICDPNCKCPPSMCRDKTLKCKNSKICGITCSDFDSCSGSLFDGLGTTDLQVKCKQDRSCQNTKIKCGNTDCDIECAARDSCNDAEITGNFNHFRVECSADRACQRSSIVCQSRRGTGRGCNIYCNKGSDTCEDMTITQRQPNPHNGKLFVECSGNDRSCKKSEINCGPGGCDIICNGKDDSCSEAVINCGEGECNVECIGDRRSCSKMTLNCGKSSECNLKCGEKTDSPCQDIIIKENDNFNCEGPMRKDYCPMATQ